MHSRPSQCECSIIHSRGDKHPPTIGELPKLIHFSHSLGLPAATQDGGVVCWVISYHSRYISPIPYRPDIGRMWKCFAKVKNFCFILGFWYGPGVLMWFKLSGGLIGGRGCLYLTMQRQCTLLTGRKRGGEIEARGSQRGCY